MDSNINEEELLKDPKKLLTHVSERIDEMQQILNDDKDFCDKDIGVTIQNLQRIEKKFEEKLQEFRDKLEQIRQDNENRSEDNQKQFNNELQEIRHLYSSEKYPQTWKKFKDYENQFQQRTLVIHEIPKLHINESDIEQLFLADYKTKKPSTQPTVVQTSTISTALTVNDDEQDNVIMTNKERLRKGKVIESDVMDKDDNDTEDFNHEKTETDISGFGIRSKPLDNQQTTTISTMIENNIKSPSTTVTPRPRAPFSMRLGQTSNSKNLPFSGRNISPMQNGTVHSRDNQNQVRSTPTPPNSASSSIQRPVISNNPSRTNTLTLNPVSHYQHESNKFLLMACSAQYIVLFKSQWNRLDRWQLGAIERRHHNEHSLDWHDGLIISMGYIEKKNSIYMFTERDISIYSLFQRRKVRSHMLPRGNDDGSEINNVSYNESQRGIGTVYDESIYHIYLNRNARWTLSKNSYDTYSHIHDKDLTRIFPDVDRFIHLCVNDKTINFLVQMNDSSYAVVFCSKNDYTTNEYRSPVILPYAQKPITISSAYITRLHRYLFFINDPSMDTLHILTTEEYLESCFITAHALCYVADKHELMVVTNSSISSINLNEENSFFSKYSVY